MDALIIRPAYRRTDEKHIPYRSVTWRADLRTWAPSAEGLTPQQPFDALVDVHQDENGNWVEN